MSKARVGNKLARELMSYARQHGFEWDGKFTGNGHIRMRHPRTGAQVFIGGTPGEGRAAINTRKDIERAARGRAPKNV